MIMETWATIKEGYEVSNLGRVRSTGSRARILKMHPNPKGYLQVVLGAGNHYRVHRLVGMFHVPNPFKLKYLNHKNGVKTDNAATNLEWCTAAYNNLHAYRVLSKKASPQKGGKNGIAKKLINSDGFTFPYIGAAAKAYKMKSSTLSAMLTGQNPNRTDLQYLD